MQGGGAHCSIKVNAGASEHVVDTKEQNGTRPEWYNSLVQTL